MNENPYGNGTAIFTRDGGAARQFQFEAEAGMVGINVPIPVPVAYYSFGGWKASLFGDTTSTGRRGSTSTPAAGRHLALARPGHLEGRPGLSANAQEPNGGGQRGRCCSCRRRACARRPGSTPRRRARSERARSGSRQATRRFRSRARGAGASSPGRSPSPGIPAHACRARSRGEDGRYWVKVGALVRAAAGRPLRARPAPRDARPPLRARRRRRAGRPNRAVRPGDARLLLRRGRAGDRVQRLRRHPAGLLLPARRRRPRRALVPRPAQPGPPCR